jgi:hypothetical protein
VEKLGTTSFLGEGDLLRQAKFSLLECTNFSDLSCFWCRPHCDGIRNDSVPTPDADDEDVRFLGDWDDVEQINDASGLPPSLLAAHPSIKTWKTVLA